MNKRSVLGWISVNFLTLPGCIQRLISVHRLLCGGLGGGSQCGRAVGTSPWSDEQDNCHSLAGDGLWMGYREMDGNGWKWEIRVQVLRSWRIAFCVPRSKKQFSKWSALARPLSRYFAGAGCIVLRWHDSREVLQPLSLPRHPKNEASRNAWKIYCKWLWLWRFNKFALVLQHEQHQFQSLQLPSI